MSATFCFRVLRIYLANFGLAHFGSNLCFKFAPFCPRWRHRRTSHSSISSFCCPPSRLPPVDLDSTWLDSLFHVRNCLLESLIAQHGFCTIGSLFYQLSSSKRTHQRHPLYFNARSS